MVGSCSCLKLVSSDVLFSGVEPLTLRSITLAMLVLMDLVISLFREGNVGGLLELADDKEVDRRVEELCGIIDALAIE